MVEYIDQGVRLGWLLDPKSDLAEIYRPGRPVESSEAPGDTLRRGRPAWLRARPQRHPFRFRLKESPMAIGSKTRRRFTTRLGICSSGILMTPEEFDNLPEYLFNKWWRYELINGVLVVTPPPAMPRWARMKNWATSSGTSRSIIRKARSSIVNLPEQTIYATSNRRRADRAIWTGLGSRTRRREGHPLDHRRVRLGQET